MKIWDFFENLDEMVYVSDIETHELVYMNKYLRDSLGCGSEYMGKMCYRVLQGMDSPCSFCTNCQLEAGQFVSWTHMNPVLNRRVLLKDTLIHADGRSYRLELAINADSDMANQSPFYYTRSETILNECIQQIFSTASAEESIHKMLAYIGKSFSCDRAYIFEINDNKTTDNTYEWCADNVTPQKDCLQSLSLSSIDWWLSLFYDNQVTMISDLEEIRTKYPEAYAILKPQDIHCLAAGPIKTEDEIIGFIGVDNPTEQMMPMIESFLNVIGYFTSTLLRRRDLVQRLNSLSYHDQLTGALNRHALTEQYGDLPMNSVGVIYCDITGLKAVNDSKGHKAGDQLICHCYALLQSAVDTCTVYRTGGDEFVVLCPNCSESDFQSRLRALQDKIHQDQHHIAVGYIWSDTHPLNLEKLIAQADEVMYQDKRDYYRTNIYRPGVDRRKSDGICSAPAPRQRSSDTKTPFQTFLDTSYYDIEALFQSVSQQNDSSYFYLGDMQKDLFYISDNMREDFGFCSNLVPGLLHLWADRISTPEFQDMYWQDISGMLREKRTVHDLRYRVRDIYGNNQWIRCYGILTWNEDKSKPLFFSGRVTHQDANFVVDPTTGFPREQASVQSLVELKNAGRKTLVIGFSLNGITEVNSTKGREAGDRLIQKVANALTEKLSWEMSLYRLEGARCMAIVNPICLSQGQDYFVEQIRTVIKSCYANMDVSVQNTCSFGLIEYPNGNMAAEDLVENLVSLIRVAKQEVKQPYVDYSTQNIQRIKEMSNMAMALSQDVAHNMEHFRIVIQPVVSAGDGAPIGGEVLLRWSFQGRDISPAMFIPVLEKNGLIQEVGRWVFEQAVSTCVRLQSYNPAFYLTFNVSLHQLSDAQLLPFMKSTLEKYALSGSSLVAELTESSLDEQPEQLDAFVQECQKMGLYIALDDFGSGYSSLRMLLQYPSSIIKLDRSLVNEVTESEAKMHFIRSIVFACHQFGKTVCMEGVEHADQNEIILNTGCDMIQGYYYYRPMELSDMYQLVSQDQSAAFRKEDTECPANMVD